MGADGKFRAALLVLYLLAGLIQVYYGRKGRPGRPVYSANKEALQREGWLILVPHTAALGLMVVWAVIYAAAPSGVRWSMMPLTAPVRWLGVALGVLSLAGLIVVHRALGGYWSWDLRIQENHRLVTDGIYARVRHPMYTVLFVHTIALGLASASWLFMLFCVVRMVALYRRIAKEEAMLIAQFGDGYRQYMRRTGRFFPRL